MYDKTLVLDMDGTFVDLYGVKGWYEDLRSENPRPYLEAKPFYPMEVFNTILELLKDNGWHIVITTWLAKNSSKEYNDLVRKAKLAWLEMYNVPYDEIHLVKYGTTKADCTRKLGGMQVLVDDNEKIRNGWSLGSTINANEDILERLLDLLEEIA